MAFLYYFVFLLIAGNRCTARPSDNINSDGGQEFEFPTVMKPGLEMKITGTLNGQDARFDLLLLNKENTNKAKCKVTFDFQENEKIIVTNAMDSPSESIKYSLHSPVNRTDTTFDLKINAREVEFGNVFSFNFKGNNDPAPIIDCPVNDFDSNSIVFKGDVKQVNIINFNFTEEYYQGH